MEGRDDGGGKVMGLIEKATKSSAQEVDPRLLKAIKLTLRYSDSEVRLGAETLMELMKHHHSQVRLLTLHIIDEIFMRSKLFRALIVENLDQLLSLSVGFRTNLPLPAPSAVATILRTKAIEFLEKWNLTFGLHYKEIRLGFDYLKNTLKLKFPDLQANAARIQRERQEREMRTKEILRNKFDSLRNTFGLLKGEIGETIEEIKECLEIVQWRGDDGIPLAILDEEDYEEIRCSHLRQIRLESLKQSDKVEETSENRVVFDVLREKCKLLVKKHLISVQEGISLLTRVDVSDNRTRDSLLKELIDIKNNILATEKKCEEVGFTISRMIDTREKEETDEEEEDDIWEEDDGKVGTDPVKNVAPLPRSQNGEGSSFQSSSEAHRSTSESSSNKASSTRKFGTSGGSLRDNLISEAPVMNWGSQLSNWDSTTEVRANHRGLELESHWGRVDQDAVIPADKIAELNLQATVYREERAEIHPCHAPLKKGGLCQRRDLRACPFHGPIVPRDDEGNPITQESSENQTGIDQDVPMDESTLVSDPNQLARQIAKQALKNIREKDREELMKIANRAKLAKVREHNFSVLRDAALASTSKSAVIDEQFDRVFAARKNKKQTFSSTRRKKTTSKDRISERLLSNRVKGTKPKQLPPQGDDEKYRETAANQCMDCTSTMDVTDDEEIHQDRHSYASVPKHHSNNSSANAASALLPTTTSVHELLECPVCTNSMYPPIHQCHNGHTLCSTCKTRVHNRCPTCRQELGDIRCLALEKVAESLELPCKYMSLGCPEIFPYYSKLKHETICNFRPYNCPYAGSECSVMGDIPFLVAHLRDDHKVDMHSGCTFNHRYVKSNPREVENATWMLTVFHCFGQYFCLHFEAFQLGMAPVYMAFLRFMGDETEARNYNYSLEVGGYGRKLTWEGTPRSVRDSHRKVRDSHDGLIIQRNMALFFSGGDRKELKLRVTGRIWKEQQQSGEGGGACIPNLS
ncbi:unnamed protein product [Thlaspi arvense]|uniref:RING-type E3 ubiquitin transferase n=1 Tax=Thlaspi arvense TaxID=13288 RepID=A0AAU9SDR9_THLAR|nr:unnamed protein product [Thlaspi arvense]